jgi:aconitate hydratase
LSSTGREDSQVQYIEQYSKAAGLFRDYEQASQDPVFSDVLELDLSTVVPSVSGPKRPHDRVSVSEFKEDFQKCLMNKVRTYVWVWCAAFQCDCMQVGFKGYQISPSRQDDHSSFKYQDKEYSISHGWL